MSTDAYNCIVVLGPTASGKTRLACELALNLGGEIISADSRQVYKHLDIGTGKDLLEYNIQGKIIPYHLIDICEPSEQFYLHDFMNACEKAFLEIRERNKLPVICGGTGLYLDSLRKDFSFTQVKENPALRKTLESFSKQELLKELDKFPAHLTAHADRDSTKRLVRAMEIASHMQQQPEAFVPAKKIYNPFYIGIDVSYEERRQRITKRLLQRMDSGLIEETEQLHRSGLSHERLEFLGLEYKFTSLFIRGIITEEELFEQLLTAICQFSKRQMTWFRKMEKEGVKILWVKRDEPIETILKQIPF